MKLGVVGATGLVGQVILDVLAERGTQVDEFRAFASARGAGQRVVLGGLAQVVENAARADFAGLDLVLMSAGADAARALAPRAVEAGAIVIDNSSAFRADPDVPLVVSEVNPGALASIPRGIVANPNCTTMVAMTAVGPLHAAAGLRRLVVSSYQAVSGAGRDGVDELCGQVRSLGTRAEGLTTTAEMANYVAGSVFPERIAFNVVPLAGGILDDGSDESAEERKLVEESRRILGTPELAVTGTCVRVPVVTGHSMSIHAEFERPLPPERALEVLREARGVELADLPTPLAATGRDATLVGRVRADTTVPHGLALFVCGDNLRKGAALNAVQIAEELVARGALGS